MIASEASEKFLGNVAYESDLANNYIITLRLSRERSERKNFGQKSLSVGNLIENLGYKIRIKK